MNTGSVKLLWYREGLWKWVVEHDAVHMTARQKASARYADVFDTELRAALIDKVHRIFQAALEKTFGQLEKVSCKLKRPGSTLL